MPGRTGQHLPQGMTVERLGRAQPPRGYVAGQYGQNSIAGRNTYQGGRTYGGRFGPDGEFGLLIGGSADRNNRAIEDVEPSWGVYYDAMSAPTDWSQRDSRTATNVRL